MAFGTRRTIACGLAYLVPFALLVVALQIAVSSLIRLSPIYKPLRCEQLPVEPGSIRSDARWVNITAVSKSTCTNANSYPLELLPEQSGMISLKSGSRLIEIGTVSSKRASIPSFSQGNWTSDWEVSLPVEALGAEVLNDFALKLVLESGVEAIGRTSMLIAMPIVFKEEHMKTCGVQLQLYPQKVGPISCSRGLDTLTIPALHDEFKTEWETLEMDRELLRILSRRKNAIICSAIIISLVFAVVFLGLSISTLRPVLPDKEEASADGASWSRLSHAEPLRGSGVDKSVAATSPASRPRILDSEEELEAGEKKSRRHRGRSDKSRSKSAKKKEKKAKKEQKELERLEAGGEEKKKKKKHRKSSKEGKKRSKSRALSPSNGDVADPAEGGDASRTDAKVDLASDADSRSDSEHARNLRIDEEEYSESMAEFHGETPRYSEQHTPIYSERSGESWAESVASHRQSDANGSLAESFCPEENKHSDANGSIVSSPKTTPREPRATASQPQDSARTAGGRSEDFQEMLSEVEPESARCSARSKDGSYRQVGDVGQDGFAEPTLDKEWETSACQPRPAANYREIQEPSTHDVRENY